MSIQLTTLVFLTIIIVCISLISIYVVYSDVLERKYFQYPTAAKQEPPVVPPNYLESKMSQYLIKVINADTYVHRYLPNRDHLAIKDGDLRGLVDKEVRIGNIAFYISENIAVVINQDKKRENYFGATAYTKTCEIDLRAAISVDNYDDVIRHALTVKKECTNNELNALLELAIKKPEVLRW